MVERLFIVIEIWIFGVVVRLFDVWSPIVILVLAPTCSIDHIHGYQLILYVLKTAPLAIPCP